VFIQVLQGRIGDRERLRQQLDAWLQDQAAQAEGWLGTTGGATDDGHFIAVVRFDSAEAARRNSDRPAQGQWWKETEQYFDGPVQFHDYEHATVLGQGGSDDAGFVQVIQGQAGDIDRLIAHERGLTQRLADLRPEIIGGTYAWDDSGQFTQTVYFTSEAEAREGERRMEEDAPDDLRAAYEEYLLLATDLAYFDLRDPLLFSGA
jgi:hypothetical protein